MDADTDAVSCGLSHAEQHLAKVYVPSQHAAPVEVRDSTQHDSHAKAASKQSASFVQFDR